MERQRGAGETEKRKATGEVSDGVRGREREGK